MARIGSNDNSISPQAQEAVKAIREGRTEDARQNRLGMSLLNAGITGTLVGAQAGITNIDDHYKNQAREQAKKNKAAQAAIAKVKQTQGVRADNTRWAGAGEGPSGSPVSPFSGVGETQMNNAAYGAANRGVTHADPYTLKDSANAELNRIQGDDAAEHSRIARTWGSTDAFDKADQEAGAMGSDINTAKQNIDSAGMMGSRNTGSDLSTHDDPYAYPGRTWGQDPIDFPEDK